MAGCLTKSSHGLTKVLWIFLLVLSAVSEHPKPFVIMKSSIDNVPEISTGINVPQSQIPTFHGPLINPAWQTVPPSTPSKSLNSYTASKPLSVNKPCWCTTPLPQSCLHTFPSPDADHPQTTNVTRTTSPTRDDLARFDRILEEMCNSPALLIAYYYTLGNRASIPNGATPVWMGSWTGFYLFLGAIHWAI
ncbi:uncharacterized protein LOC110857376 [Folsomia candida]|nr:uncharacterized protein LOC110857376 [Folsomia candida]XP_035713439.1 uncharacterized protein LOC110857376 [Folsomia candida]